MVENSRWGLALVLALAACGRASERGAEARQGVVELDERAIGFEVAGRIRSVEVKRGDVVAAGATLATLDDGLAKPLRDARAADVRVADAQLELLRAGSRREDVRATEAQLASARETEAIVRRNHERVKSLSDGGAATAAALDETESQLARAEGERRVLEQRLQLLRSGARKEELAAAEAKAGAARAALAAEEERLARSVVRAPAAATVVDVHLDPGEVAGAGAAVVTLADTTHPFVDVFVPVGALEGIHVGTSASVRVDASPRAFGAHVENVGRTTEFTPRYLFSERERPNLVVRVRVRVDDAKDGELHAGVPAEVVLQPGPLPTAGGAR